MDEMTETVSTLNATHSSVPAPEPHSLGAQPEQAAAPDGLLRRGDLAATSGGRGRSPATAPAMCSSPFLPATGRGILFLAAPMQADPNANGLPDEGDMEPSDWDCSPDNDVDAHGLNGPPDADEMALDYWDNGPDEYDDEDIEDAWKQRMDEDATRLQVRMDEEMEEDEERRLADEELVTNQMQAPIEAAQQAEVRAAVPESASQVQVAATEGKGSLPSEGVHQHADIVAPPASASGAADTGAAESTGASVDDHGRCPGKDDPGEHGVAEPAEAHEASGDQSHAPRSAPAPATAEAAPDLPKPAHAEVLTWDTIRRDGVRWPALLVRRIGDRMATLLVKLVQAAAESADGIVKYDAAFRRDGPQDASGRECNCFTSEGARFALRRLTEAAQAGTYGESMRAFMATIRTTKTSVNMSGDAVARAYGDLFKNEGEAHGHAGRNTNRHDTAPPRQPAGGPDNGRPAAPGGSGRKRDGAPPEGGMGGRTEKVDVGGMEGSPVAKVTFPPLEIHVCPAEDGKGFGLRDPAQWRELPERLARDVYPLIPGYAGVKDSVILKELALQHLQEWLAFYVGKLAALLTAPDGPRRLGLMFCGWVERRSTFTFDDRGARVPWLLGDLWSAARSHGYQARYGRATCPSSGSTVDGVYFSAGMLKQEMREVVGDRSPADLAQQPKLVFELGVDFINLGAALLDRLGLEVTPQQRRRLVVSSIYSDELDRSVQARRVGLAGCMLVDLRRRLMKVRGRWRNPDGSINAVEFDRLASGGIEKIRRVVAERFPLA